MNDAGDFSAELASVTAPVLLLWSDDDSISPVAMGRILADLFPHITLYIVAGEHDHANVHAADLAPRGTAHLNL